MNKKPHPSFRRFRILCRARLIFGLLILMSGTARSEPLTIDADAQYEFAADCFSQADYECAEDEFRRFIRFFPEDGRIDEARFHLGLSRFRMEKWEEALKAFSVLTEEAPKTDANITDWHIRASFMMSETHLRMKYPLRAVTPLRNLLVQTTNEAVRDETRYRIAWIYLDMGSWEDAGKYFLQIRPEKQEAYRVSEIMTRLDQARRIPRKNPSLAGTLSALPGAGFLYCGRYRDALTAFILNGALILAAYESFDSDMPALGGVISVVELGFYMGGIYGAANAAHKYNRNETRKYIREIRKHFSVGIAPAGKMDGAAVMVSVRF